MAIPFFDWYSIQYSAERIYIFFRYLLRCFPFILYLSVNNGIAVVRAGTHDTIDQPGFRLVSWAAPVAVQDIWTNKQFLYPA